MSNNPPGYEKDNVLTRAAARVAQLNQQYGMRAYGGGAPDGEFARIDDSPAPRLVQEYDVRNAPISPDGTPLPVVSGLSPDEQERLDREWAQQSGQKVGSQKEADDDGIGGNYGTMDEATPVRRAPSRGPMKPAPIRFEGYAPLALDLTKLQSVDFENGQIVVGGVALKIEDDTMRSLAELAVEAAVDSLRKSLDSALAKYKLKQEAPASEPAQGAEVVQPVPTSETADGVSPGQQ